MTADLRALIAAGREHDARMEPGPWRTHLRTLLDALERTLDDNHKLLECERDTDAEIDRLRAEVADVRAQHSRVSQERDRLGAAIHEHIAAHRIPASSANRGEASAWISRTTDAERALAALVRESPTPLDQQIPTLYERAQWLEGENQRLRSGIVEAAAACSDLGDDVSGYGMARRLKDLLSDQPAITTEEKR